MTKSTPIELESKWITPPNGEAYFERSQTVTVVELDGGRVTYAYADGIRFTKGAAVFARYCTPAGNA